METTLAVDFRASRFHIRSALRLLEQENLTQHILQCGFVAKGAIEGIIEEIVELWITLERVVFKRLVQAIIDEKITQLRKATQRVVALSQNDVVEDAAEKVDHFYGLVYEKNNLERVTSILDTYTGYLKIIQHRSTPDIDRNQASVQLLQGIMGTIEEGNTETLLHHIERRGVTID